MLCDQSGERARRKRFGEKVGFKQRMEDTMRQIEIDNGERCRTYETRTDWESLLQCLGPESNKKVQQGSQTSALAMHLPLAR